MERDDDLEAREERAAASEAGSIGGEVPDAGLDPADRPVAEGGGGEAEGFELAEEDLVRNASHDEGEGDPTRDAFTAEVEADASTAEYGEPDEVDPTEPTRDPEAGDDDPGEGPGIAPER